MEYTRLYEEYNSTHVLPKIECFSSGCVVFDCFNVTVFECFTLSYTEKRCRGEYMCASFLSDKHVEKKHYCLDFSSQKQQHSESEDDVCYRKYAERRILFFTIETYGSLCEESHTCIKRETPYYESPIRTEYKNYIQTPRYTVILFVK